MRRLPSAGDIATACRRSAAARSSPSRSAVSAGVPYTAALLRSQGKSDVAITSALRQEGYTPAQIAKILQEMNK